MERTLAGGDDVGMSLPEREETAAVVQRDAGIAGDDPGAEALEDRLDQRDDVAVAIGGGQVDRVTVRFRMNFR